MAITDRTQLRREHVQTVMTHDEKGLVERAARHVGDKVSGWARVVLLRAAGRTLRRKLTKAEAEYIRAVSEEYSAEARKR